MEAPRTILRFWASWHEKCWNCFRLQTKTVQFQLGAQVDCSSLDFRGRDLPQEWVAGGVPPPGGLSIRRPPKVCQRRGELASNWLCPITAGQSRHSFAQFDLKCSFPYPFLSPGAWGPPQTRRQKAEKFGFFAFFLDFFAFRTALEK